MSLALVGCGARFNPNSLAGRQKNADYMRQRLGEIVLDYREKHGALPEGFELALNESRKTLPNRGDYYGRPMVYEQLTDEAFRFVAFGENGEYDGGEVDDVVVEYRAGTWTDNASALR